MLTLVVYVLSKNNRPLMPTKRLGRVRRLLKAGLAKPVCRKPFTIQLLYDTSEYKQSLYLGIDPGSHELAAVVRKETGEVCYAGHLQTRTDEVTENMKERRMHRNSRRRHRRQIRQRRAKKNNTIIENKQSQREYKIAGIQEKLTCKLIRPKLVRFHNRYRPPGWLTPTARHLLDTHKNWIIKITKILPIAEIRIEYGKFDIHKLQAPQIAGKQYQNGRCRGYKNVKEYVLCRDQHRCRLCNKHKDVILHVHHVVWRNQAGADTPENLVTLCPKCHEKVHQNSKVNQKLKAIFAGMPKRYVATTLLNTIMPFLYEWLQSSYDKVSKTYGYITKDKRHQLDAAKSHAMDAYCISWKDSQKRIPPVDWKDIAMYEYIQARRHDRQIIHAVRERNYKRDNKIVAQNRNQRTGQVTDSLADFIAKNGASALAGLSIKPGKKVIRSDFNAIQKGDVVRYKNQIYVVKGYGEMGRTIGLVGMTKYVPFQACSLISRNTGIVCV